MTGQIVSPGRLLMMVCSWLAFMNISHSSTVDALLLTKEPVSKLLQTHSASIDKLKQVCEAQLGTDALASLPYSNNVFFLRYCIDADAKKDKNSADSSGDPQELMVERLKSNLKWRSTGSGKSICDAATAALQQASDSIMGNESWNNEPVLKAAPHASVISQYITPSNVITTTSSQDDLVYCIRAGQIDDVGLMKQVSVSEMVDFFLYAKEVNAQVANQRSLDTNDLKCVITANDLYGVKLVGGSSDFRKALSESSNQANILYPSTNGPTLLLNLPGLLSALVKLFTPLFPPEVKARLKFVQGPLKGVDDLRLVARSSASSEERAKFVQELDEFVYKS